MHGLLVRTQGPMKIIGYDNNTQLNRLLGFDCHYYISDYMPELRILLNPATQLDKAKYNWLASYICRQYLFSSVPNGHWIADDAFVTFSDDIENEFFDWLYKDLFHHQVIRDSHENAHSHSWPVDQTTTAIN